MKSVGSCYLFYMHDLTYHRHTVGKRTRELFQVFIGYITSSSSRCLRCIHVVIVFYRRRGYRRRMQLLVGGMHCNMLLELGDRILLYLYIFLCQFFLCQFTIIRRFPRLFCGMHSSGENNGNPNTGHSIYFLECVRPV